MGLAIFLIVCNLLIPAIMMTFGYIFKDRGPKNINMICGYRTEMSMKNLDTWNFAHTYCAKIWRKLGMILLISSVIISIISVNFQEDVMGIMQTVLITIQVIILIASIFPVEKALREQFDQNGNRKA